MWMELSVSAAGDGSDAVDRRDSIHLARSERELCGRDEVVAREAIARLAEVAKAEAPSAVLVLELLALPVRELRKPTPLCWGEIDRTRHRHVRADAGERREDLGLRVVEPGRERVDGDDEAHSESEAERRQDRAPAPSAELREHVCEKEHDAQENPCA